MICQSKYTKSEWQGDPLENVSDNVLEKCSVSGHGEK